MDFFGCLRSDLACETVDVKGRGIQGATYSAVECMGFTVECLCIRTSAAERKTGRAKGEYCTVHCGHFHLMSQEKERALCRLLASALSSMAEKLTGRRIDSELSLMVVGLGNRELTADAVGPLTIRRLTATRHLQKYEQELYRALGSASLTLLSPGVMGQTGMEAAELVEGAVNAVQPHLILLIDALAARGCDRLASTIQLSNVGVCPGSGVGNHRKSLTKESLGVPVMTVGIPTVVNSSALIMSALEEANIHEISYSLRKVLENGADFFVTPKDCDAIIQGASRLLSSAIELAFVELIPSSMSIF